MIFAASEYDKLAPNYYYVYGFISASSLSLPSSICIIISIPAAAMQSRNLDVDGKYIIFLYSAWIACKNSEVNVGARENAILNR